MQLYVTFLLCYSKKKNFDDKIEVFRYAIRRMSIVFYTTLNIGALKMTFKQTQILGVPFVHTTRHQFVTHLHECIYQEKRIFVVTANPEIVMKANTDHDYNKMIQQAHYITADGIGIVKAAQILKTPLPERVTGYDLFIDLLKKGNEHSYRIYLLGATEETLQKAIKNVETTYPNVNIVGAHHGFFNPDSNYIQAEISDKKPDLIFVALGVPRQEKWIAENLHSFQKGIFIGVGGSFDVLAGTVKRAPATWQKANLEWLYRIIKQPSRLKRSLALPKFAMKVLGQKIKGTK